MSYSTGAGVYANPAAAGQDIQRSHQYLNYDPQSSSPPGQLTDLPGETYDTVSLDCPDDCIDRDIDGAPVADANGAKTYSNWNLNLVDYPTSPPDTSVFGINDANMGWLNSGSYVPAIFTGGYCTNGCVDGEPDIGFYWQSGNFVSVDSYLNGETKPYGVNNFFQIVGHYYPYPGVSGPEQGFFFSSSNGGSAYPLNYPNAASIFPYGINDAGQIVGAYSDTANKGHAFFIADQDTWTGIDHSGQGTFFRESTGLDRLRATTRTLRATTDLSTRRLTDGPIWTAKGQALRLRELTTMGRSRDSAGGSLSVRSGTWDHNSDLGVASLFPGLGCERRQHCRGGFVRVALAVATAW